MFEKKDNKYTQIDELKFDNINNIIDLVKNKNKKIIFVGNGSIAHKDMIEFEMKEATIVLDEEKNKLNAKNIGTIAFEKKDEAVDTNNLKPLYLRASNAERETFKK